MGDRRNVVVEFNSKNSVALYTHWSGTELPQIVANALARGRARWTDPTYLTRIIFSEMIQHEILDETGYGIEPVTTGETNYCESSPGYDLVINCTDQTVQ